MNISLKTLSNHKLLRELDELVAKSHHDEAELLAHLAEVDRRELYLEQGCSCMYRYCTEVLHFSEATAFHRIRAARAARSYPLLLERIREGAIHLSGANLLAPALTLDNHVELLDLAHHKSKRAIEVLLANRAPKPDVPGRVRKLPDPRRPVPAAQLRSKTGGPSQETSSCRAAVSPPVLGVSRPVPLGGRRFKIQFTGSQGLCGKLREVQALLRHQIPDGDLAEIFDRALTLLLDEAKRKKFCQTSRPRRGSKASQKRGAASRHIPAEIKRAVFARDGGRCAFVAANGPRCSSQDFLEFHHVDPWARAKRHSIDRIELRCRGHNRYAALQDYGAAHMACFVSRDHSPRG